MKRPGIYITLLSSVLFAAAPLRAQQQTDAGYQSISESELRNHIFFLASDYMKGRVSTTPEYAIAAEYVATQFSAAGLQPLANQTGYMQGLPFARTIYNDQLPLVISRKGSETSLIHQKDFKVLSGTPVNLENLPLVYVGYGIEEPAQGWNDFKDIDLKGKIAVCLTGAPVKDGKPVLSKAAHDKYSGRRGYFFKASGAVSGKGAVALILVDPDGTSGLVFQEINSSFVTSKTSYLGTRREYRSAPRLPIYLATPAFLNLSLIHI